MSELRSRGAEVNTTAFNHHLTIICRLRYYNCLLADGGVSLARRNLRIPSLGRRSHRSFIRR